MVKTYNLKIVLKTYQVMNSFHMDNVYDQYILFHVLIIYI
jgi:hypothetical protein